MSSAKTARPDKVSTWQYHDTKKWQDGSDYIKVSFTTKTAGTSAPSTTTTFPSTTSTNSTTTASPSMPTKDILLISLAAAAAFAIVGFLIILILYIKKTRKPLVPERVSDKDNKRPLHSMNCHTHLPKYFHTQGTIEVNDDYGTYCDGVVYNTVEDTNAYYGVSDVDE